MGSGTAFNSVNDKLSVKGSAPVQLNSIGAAFSSFTGSGPLIGVIAFGVVVFLVYLVARTHRRIDVLALGLILGGALGNLADRVFRGEGVLDGAVVDWIDWWFIPTFNVADAALNVGVAVLLIAALFLPDHG